MDVYRRRLRILYRMRRLTKISCAGPSFASIRTLSDSFISISDPTGSEHQRIYSSLRETELVSLCFHARIQTSWKITMLRTKNEKLFSDSQTWTPLAKIPGFAHGKRSVLIAIVQYRVRDIPIIAAPADLSPESSLCIKNVILWLIFIKGLSCCWVGKGEGAKHCKV